MTKNKSHVPFHDIHLREKGLMKGIDTFRWPRRAVALTVLQFRNIHASVSDDARPLHRRSGGVQHVSRPGAQAAARLFRLNEIKS